ncbi:hypothetical protein BRD18_02335 [Halobacteriales archaeon SW_7_71_33]|nr:MAG: hypothetical protein BRD18_02335 [Halobacteriales archaeon SW_7_71_33]
MSFSPDTLSMHAFSALRQDSRKFAAAASAGSVGRLLVTLGIAGAAVALVRAPHFCAPVGSIGM